MYGLTWKILWVSLLLTLNLFSQSPTHTAKHGELIVQLKGQAQTGGLEAQLAAYNLRSKKCLSRRLNIWLFEYNAAIAKSAEVITVLDKQTDVQHVQENHYVTMRRGDPDDPYYPDQWALHNTGQSGGQPDADIDAPEAWEIVTGGNTILGDEVVIAIIDGGADLSHPEIQYWKNEAEIPGNGLDDDDNGYIDDYDGWNARQSNGIIPADRHGTHVAGIAGAIGNNGDGISGVNRDVRIMPIAGASSLESVVIEAYSYIYEMRSLYNESDGAAGAFVVVSNASFGVDYGDPDDYPIWCAMFDSLGAIGVLSCAATANIGMNVEFEGDMPTTCDSDYLITVTNTTHTDRKYQSAAYGTTSIDLGAPGTNIFSTLPGNSYGNMTGTSMAAPFVSGAVALMFAGADISLMTDYENNPQETGLLFKEWLMAGVDTLVSLQYKTLSGGRLNLRRCLELVQGYADSDDPNPPTVVSAFSDYTTPNTIDLAWEAPVLYAGGDSLPVGAFMIDIERNDSLIASLSGDVTAFADSALTDGMLYEYVLTTRVLFTDSTSSRVHVSWHAGGSPQPAAPTDVSCQADSINAHLRWTDPALQADGTFLDDLDSIYIYRGDSLIAIVAPAVENYVDTPPAGRFHSYQLAAKDQETPFHLSERSRAVRRYVGSAPEFMVWVGPGAIDRSAASGDSIWAALAANGESAILSNNLFELGEDLAIYEGIFVVLGIFGSNHVLDAESAEAMALESYLHDGGRLFVEGGDCFNFDPDNNGYNIRPWFDLAEGPDGSADVAGMLGVNDLSAFTFSYSGANEWMDGLQPISSVPLWQNDMNSDILGVFHSGYGSGRAIGIVPSFGGFDSTAVPLNKSRRMAATQKEWSESAHLVKERGESLLEASGAFEKKVSVANPKQQRKVRRYTDPLQPFSAQANSKAELMAAYLNLFRAEGTPVLGISDSLLRFSVSENGTASRILTITNNTGSLPSDLIFTVSGDPLDEWLQIASITDTLSRQAYRNLTVSVMAQDLAVGDYSSAITIVSNDSLNPVATVPVELSVVAAPSLVLVVDSVLLAADPGEKDSLMLEIHNGGGGTLQLSIFSEDSLADSSAAQYYNMNQYYRWQDSNAPDGPLFDWQDIQHSGNGLALGDDDSFGLALPFQFPFYEAVYDSIWISSNGYLTFGDNATSPGNDPLPHASQPQNIIAPFWDDLDPDGATIYYEMNDNALTVQYQQVAHWGGMGSPGLYTFQVILHRNGVIRFQYLDMRHTLNSASIGIENHDGSQGVEICYNTLYVENSLAVVIEPTMSWLSAKPWELTLAPDSSASIQVTASAALLGDGVYETSLVLAGNDPLNAEHRLPVRFTVGLGNQPQLALDVDSVDFEFVGLLETAHQTIYIHNTGNAPLNLLEATTSNSVFRVDSLVTHCSAGDSVAVTISFTPTEVAAFEGILTLESNDPLWSEIEIMLIGNGENPTGINDQALPKVFALAANYPNPFNPATTIAWELPQAARVSLIIYNALGQKVRKLVSTVQAPGRHQQLWDGRDDGGNSVSSGVYIYRLAALSQNGEQIFFAESRKMMLIK